MVDTGRNIFYSYTAALGLDRLGIVVIGKRKMPEDGILGFARQKTLTKFRLDELVNRMPPPGFFTPIATAMVASDSELKSAGYHEKIGWWIPCTASLAALVSVCTTRLHQSGKMVSRWNKSTRSAHLASKSNNTGGAGSQELYCLFAPLINLWRQQ